MSVDFYEHIRRLINIKGEVITVTVINAAEKYNNLIGEKVCICNDEVYYKNETNFNFWNENLVNLNISNGTSIVRTISGIDFFVEQINTRPHLVICGGGHIALPLSKIGKLLEYEVTVIDERVEFANSDRFNSADNVICESFENALNKVKDEENTYFVIVTRGHKADKECLAKILTNKYKYVGMIGSSSKVNYVMDSLRKDGFDDEILNKVHSPIGIKIGSETPEEIAISIVAEIISEKNKKIQSTIDDDILEKIINSRARKILATIVEKSGSTPRGVGAKMLIQENGTCSGTIGGGNIEYEVYNEALRIIKNGTSKVESYNLSNSSSASLGMVCGGRVKVFFELID